MADPKKPSAFDPPAQVKKADGKMHDTDGGAPKSNDTSTTPDEPSHVTQLRQSLRKLLGFPSKDPDFVEGGKPVSSAVEAASQGVKDAPGSTNY